MSVSSNGFHLTADQIARLTNLARETGKPLPDVLDEALAAYHPQAATESTSDSESFFDVASRLGFVGCIKGTPADLSTNKRHMEGFGQR
jgi:hypothetical protein